MCVAVPSKVVSVENLTAVVDIHGARRTVSLAVLAGQVEVGEYVLVHAGFAIQVLKEEDAQETLLLLNELMPENL